MSAWYRWILSAINVTSSFISNPLTPVLPVTVRTEPWSLVHFWCHYLWPNLALSILNFSRRKRHSQWCPDQSDWCDGTWTIHENAQKLEWKTRSKISSKTQWYFLEVFEASPASGFNRCNIKIRRGEKEKAKIKKEKPKDIGHFLVQKLKIFCTCLS